MDEPSLVAGLEFMRSYDAGLSSIRYPRDNVSDRFSAAGCPPFVLGKARCLTPAFAGLSTDMAAPTPDVAVLAFGTCALAAHEAATELAQDLRVGVWDARFAKPVDASLINELLARRVPIITVEDHSIVGGFGTAVLEAAASSGYPVQSITRLGLPDSWIYQDSRSRQLAEAGIDRSGLAAAIRGAANVESRAFAK
jgi:deoxyxylulose-5-phosphate synthase